MKKRRAGLESGEGVRNSGACAVKRLPTLRLAAEPNPLPTHPTPWSDPMRILRSAALQLSTALALLLMLSTAHAAYPLTVEHAQGSVTLEQVPTRVAVFDLATLDILDALGVEVAAVPEQTGPDHLKKFQHEKYAKVGTLFEPDFAALQALHRDFIIIVM